MTVIGEQIREALREAAWRRTPNGWQISVDEAAAIAERVITRAPRRPWFLVLDSDRLPEGDLAKMADLGRRVSAAGGLAVLAVPGGQVEILDDVDLSRMGLIRTERLRLLCQAAAIGLDQTRHDEDVVQENRLEVERLLTEIGDTLHPVDEDDNLGLQ